MVVFLFIFLPAAEFKWIDPKEFHLLDEYSNRLILNILKKYMNCTLFILLLQKIETKEKLLPKYHTVIANIFNIIGNVKKLVPNFFDKEKYQ